MLVLRGMIMMGMEGGFGMWDYFFIFFFVGSVFSLFVCFLMSGERGISIYKQRSG